MDRGLQFEGDAVLWTVSIRADKTSDYESLMAKLHQGLRKSSAERQRQAAGWKVAKITKSLPDGAVAYVHFINPVVKGADYSVSALLLELYPNEGKGLVDLLRNSIVGQLALMEGNTLKH